MNSVISETTPPRSDRKGSRSVTVRLVGASLLLIAVALLLTGVLLIVLQLLLLRWSLTPLRKVASDMSRVERGSSDHLDSQYPLEL
ncbi:MAG: hypothetical protein P8Y36_07065, partial [Alphaproteobacteria bacterium]